jgi:membrane-bound lytic murein transglycosylase A
VPYYDRAAIEAGALEGQKLEICWLKNPADLLAMQIEGSGRVILEDGTPLRINYDSHNGYSYTSGSSTLIKHNRGLHKERSIQLISKSTTAHSGKTAKLRATNRTAKVPAINRSYVFFRVIEPSNEGEPAGAQGVPLTPGRSIAVDRLHDYGTPFFIEANLAIEKRKACFTIPSPYDCAGYRIGDRWAGARRSVLGLRRWRGTYRQPHS